MAQMLPLLLVSLLLLLTQSSSIRISLTHVDLKLNLTRPQLLRRAIQRTKHRIAALTSTDIQTPVKFSVASYQMDYSIGTPALATTGLMDTGSDLIWTQCEPCVQCFNQTSKIYDRLNSTTFAKIPCTSPLCQSLGDRASCSPDCNYVYSYVDQTSTQGTLATETFVFGSQNPVTVPGIGFGCSDSNKGNVNGASGIVGLGRGQLSLVSQLGSGKFSYCLTSFGDPNPSILTLGSSAVINGPAQSTPLIQNPARPALYYLSLQGITVGATLLPISRDTFALRSDGTGGLVIDSGSTITALEVGGYNVLKQEFQRQVNLSVADSSGTIFDLCFQLPSRQETVQVPKLVFHFDGADMDFPLVNYLAEAQGGLLCLAIVPSRGISILGDFQQQNMRILYDVSGGKLSFVQTQCDQM